MVARDTPRLLTSSVSGGMRSPIRYRRCTSRSSSTFSAWTYKGIRRSGAAASPDRPTPVMPISPSHPHAKEPVTGSQRAVKDEFILLTHQFVCGMTRENRFGSQEGADDDDG